MGNSDPEEMCYRRFGLAWTEITGADGPNGLIFGLFGEDCDEHAIAEGRRYCFRNPRAQNAGSTATPGRARAASGSGLRTGSNSRGSDRTACWIHRNVSSRPLIRVGQKGRSEGTACPLSRWFSSGLPIHGGLKADAMERNAQSERRRSRTGSGSASKSIEYDFIYREVNPYFAAWLWVWETFKPPGPMPPDLEPFRDITKAPRGVVRSLFHQDEDGSYCALVEPYVTAAKIIEPDSVGLVQLL